MNQELSKIWLYQASKFVLFNVAAVDLVAASDEIVGSCEADIPGLLELSVETLAMDSRRDETISWIQRAASAYIGKPLNEVDFAWIFVSYTTLLDVDPDTIAEDVRRLSEICIRYPSIFEFLAPFMYYASNLDDSIDVGQTKLSALSEIHRIRDHVREASIDHFSKYGAESVPCILYT